MTDVALLKKEAKNKRTNSSRLEELARHADPSVQLAVAGNPNATSATLEHLGRSVKLNLLKAVAKNPSTPTLVLERLARHQHATVRAAVAESPVMTEAIAVQLLGDAEENVRSAVLPTLRGVKWSTSAVFELAARDSSPLVRMRAAESCTDPNILQRALGDPDWRVVVESLRNPRLSATALTVALEQHFDHLNEAGNWSVASHIVMRHDLPAHWLERFSTHSNATVRLWVAKNQNTPRATLLQLARDRDWGVLSATAALPDLPEEVYLGYAKHREMFVRLALVANPSVPRSVLEQLARDKDADIASKARRRLE
jgi:Leucine rich repeat variant